MSSETQQARRAGRVRRRSARAQPEERVRRRFKATLLRWGSCRVHRRPQEFFSRGAALKARTSPAPSSRWELPRKRGPRGADSCRECWVSSLSRATAAGGKGGGAIQDEVQLQSAICRMWRPRRRHWSSRTTWRRRLAEVVRISQRYAISHGTLPIGMFGWLTRNMDEEEGGNEEHQRGSSLLISGATRTRAPPPPMLSSFLDKHLQRLSCSLLT